MTELLLQQFEADIFKSSSACLREWINLQKNLIKFLWGYQFMGCYETTTGYPDAMKQECLEMYSNGRGPRNSERVKQVHHTTILTCVKSSGKRLPDTYAPDTIPVVGELDELETFISSKNKIWLWTAVDRFKTGILGGC